MGGEEKQGVGLQGRWDEGWREHARHVWAGEGQPRHGWCLIGVEETCRVF